MAYQVLVICVVSSIVFAYIVWRKERKKKLPPSPKGLPIIGHLHLVSPIPHQDFYKLSLRHGPIMQLFLGSVPCVVASTAEAAKEFLKTHEINFSNRPGQNVAVKGLAYDSQDFLFAFAPFGPYWKFMKKLCMSEEMRMLVADVAELMGTFNVSDFIWFLKPFDLQGFNKRIRKTRIRFDAVLDRIIKQREEERRNNKEIGGTRQFKDILDVLLDIGEDDSSEIKLTKENIKAFIMVSK